MSRRVKRVRGNTRVSSKHQVTLPAEVLLATGVRVGDALRVRPGAPGEIILSRIADPIDTFAGALTGTYPIGYLEKLRREWD